MEFKEYYIEIEDQQYGPYNLEQVRSFSLLPDTLVCVPQNGEEWKLAKEFEELVSFTNDNSQINLIDKRFNVFTTSFFYQEDGKIYGGFSVFELSNLDIHPDTMVGIGSPNNWRGCTTNSIF